jgi:O-antigen/teichoic acid export membrane protein
LGLVLLILFSNPITLLLFGEKYQQTSQILQVLSIGFIFFFLSTIPSSIILYYFGKSSVSFVITFLRYLLFIILLAFLVPSQKALGGAIAFSTSEFAAFLLMIGYTILRFQKSYEH